MTRVVRATFVGHATVLLEIGGVRVLTDPFLRPRLGPLERHGPLPRPADLGPIDLVVVSHGHPDHFDPWSLRAIEGRPRFVVPRGLGAALRALVPRVHPTVIELAPGDSASIAGVTVRGIAARHWTTPGGPRAEPMGFVLEAGPSVYFAGDTGRRPSDADDARGVDLALLPVWTWGPHLGPGHLGPRSAAELLRDLRPVHAAIPIHWATLYPRRLHRVWRRPLVDPGQRFAAHAAELAPGVDVRVLGPGASTEFVFDDGDLPDDDGALPDRAEE